MKMKTKMAWWPVAATAAPKECWGASAHCPRVVQLSQLPGRKHAHISVTDWSEDGSLGSARVSRAMFGVTPNTSQPDNYQKIQDFYKAVSKPAVSPISLSAACFVRIPISLLNEVVPY
jgi:hypothetical protein